MDNHDRASNLYLDLLEKTLTGAIFEDEGYRPGQTPVLATDYDEQARLLGRDWPRRALTMVGLTRLRHLRGLMECVLDNDVPGDFIETGVWRGGVCIYMRAVLAVRGVTDRRIWVADSFSGLPPPKADQYPVDSAFPFHMIPMLSVPLEEVKKNFAKYGMLDEQVAFLKGFFEDSLPTAPVETIAILRLDGDMYQSTWDALINLYSKVSPGGYIIVDDYSLRVCRKAIADFRRANSISAEIKNIDGTAAYWRKTVEG